MHARSAPSKHDRPAPVTIGVLAVQGAFAAHIELLAELDGVTPVEVRTQQTLATCDALILPGGESTAIRRGIERAQLRSALLARIDAGMPALGTCAGLIVLGRSLSASDDPHAPPTLGVLDVDVDRNGFGRQVHSREQHVRLGGDARPGIFIRAPRITAMGRGVSVLATLEDEPVAVRSGDVIACTYHPELAGDPVLHELLVSAARARAEAVQTV
jgi:5'-phosphate synthase pdxT subunit